MGRLESSRAWLIGTAVVALLLVVVGWFFLISPQRSKTATVQDDLGAAQLQGTTLQTRIAALTSQQARMGSYRRALQQARQALPSVDDQGATPDLLRNLQSISRATSTSLSGLTIEAPAAASTAPAAAPSSSASSSSPSSAASTAPAAPGLLSSTVTLAVSGRIAQLKAFLTQLQAVQPRAVLISSVTLGYDGGSGTGAGSPSLHLTMDVFFTPSTAAASASPTPSPGSTS